MTAPRRSALKLIFTEQGLALGAPTPQAITLQGLEAGLRP